jgi:PadR family transcriptional regulator
VAKKARAVLNALLADPHKELYGLEIYERTGLLPGTAYPVLLRLQNAGLVRSRWAAANSIDSRRPRRRYYQLTALGIVAAPTMVAEATGFLGFARRWLGWTPQSAVRVATSGTSAK